MRNAGFALALVAFLATCGRTAPEGFGEGGALTAGGAGGVVGNGGTPSDTARGGGLGGDNAGSHGCPAAPSGAAVNFCNGWAQGAMTGWGWVGLGDLDTLTSPRCDNSANGGGANESITKDTPCQAMGGSMLWSSSDALCISGSIPVVTAGDYPGNWGLMVGWDAGEFEGTAINETYSRVAFTWRGTVTPTNNAIRGVLHLAGDVSGRTYCATIRSGEPISLQSFNTSCWDMTGEYLTAQDIPKIDQMSVQISSDDRSAYTVTDFCVTGITFDGPIPTTGGASGTGGGGAGGGPGAGGVSGAGGGPNVCGVETVSIARAYSDVLLVLDRSGSMADDIAQDCRCLNSGNSSSPACPDPSACMDRWSTLSSALAAAMTSAPYIRWGLKLFSTPGGSACNVSEQVEVPVGANSANAIQQSIASITPGNNTPTAQAIKAATAYLKTVDDTNNKVILLATDGEPNCGPDGSSSTPNVEGTLGEILAARDAGFLVYVVGIGPSVGNLDSFATAGGTGRYYPATSPDELTYALSAVSRLVASCAFLLSAPPPDANNVAVYFDKSLVAKDDVNGWSFAGNPQVVQLNGEACAKLTSSMSATVTVLFGCPGMPLPPVLP